MATIKILPVHTENHLNHLLDYTANKDKTQEGTLITCHGCNKETAYDDFAKVRAENPKGTILAHQMIQSFAPGETNPETAHEIGVKLAEKMLPGFQYTVCTHVDKDHIHNHIVFNSVSSVTLQKYHGNCTTLKLMRDEGDNLCREYGLSVVEKKTGYKGLDKTTYELAREGKSWKVALCNDIDSILTNPPPNMKAFCKRLRRMDYQVETNGKNIVVTPKGAQRGIRLDTLARQFDVRYTKENIERVLNGQEPELQPFRERQVPLDPSASEWSRAEKFLFNEAALEEQMAALGGSSGDTADEPTDYPIPYPPPRMAPPPEPDADAVIDRTLEVTVARKAEIEQRRVKNKALSWVLSRRNSVLHSHNILSFLVGLALLGIEVHSLDPETRKRYNAVKGHEQRQLGNVHFSELKKVYGDVVTLVLTPEKYEKFRKLPILHSATTQKEGTIRVGFLAQSRELVSQYMEISPDSMKTGREVRAEINSRRELEALGGQRQSERRVSFSCTQGELNALAVSGIPYDFSMVRSGYRIGILAEDLPQLCTALNWNLAEKKEDIWLRDNRHAYKAVKEACTEKGQKPEFRVIDKPLLLFVQRQGIQCAAFPMETKPGFYNVAFNPTDIPKYEETVIAFKEVQIKREEILEHQRQQQQQQQEKKPHRSL